MEQEDEKGKAVGTATTVASIGAGAGVGIAALLSAPYNSGNDWGCNWLHIRSYYYSN